MFADMDDTYFLIAPKALVAMLNDVQALMPKLGPELNVTKCWLCHALDEHIDQGPHQFPQLVGEAPTVLKQPMPRPTPAPAAFQASANGVQQAVRRRRHILEQLQDLRERSVAGYPSD